jgi:hypothetical protein
VLSSPVYVKPEEKYLGLSLLTYIDSFLVDTVEVVF